jgi:hypothetical protein
MSVYPPYPDNPRGRPLPVSPVAIILGPLPLSFGAAFSWKAVRELSRENLLKGIVAVVISVALYVIFWTWGGRMLI